MLNDAELYVIAIIATVLVYVLNALAKTKVHVHRGWLTTAVYLISGVLAYAWSAVVFPAFPAWGGDVAVFAPALLDWASNVLTAVGPIVALATLIYNVLLKKILDKVSDSFFPLDKG